MTEPDLILQEIGARGRLSSSDARKAAALWNRKRRNHPNAQFMFSVGGYDDDPRPLWEIPEVAAYIRAWASLVGLDDPEEAERVFGYTDNSGLALLDLCLVFGDKPMFTEGEKCN